MRHRDVVAVDRISRCGARRFRHKVSNDLVSVEVEIDPETGAAADDVLALIDSFDFLNTEDKIAIVHDNPLRMFPLIAKTKALAAQAV